MEIIKCKAYAVSSGNGTGVAAAAVLLPHTNDPGADLCLEHDDELMGSTRIAS